MTIPPLAQRLMAAPSIALIERIAQWAFATVLDRHPGIVRRLGEYAHRRYAIAPTDIPFGFLVSPADRRISVRRSHMLKSAHATISGPIVVLLALLEGRVDGDTAFFARQISIRGDTEAILALRNVLDDAQIDLVRELSPMAGPASPIFAHMGTHLRGYLLKSDLGQWS
ncbi:SCP2 sterol-binding domain-containing protein [Pelagibacterium flavum]|uniref:SCP2 sterol-binding domain-containing protein n=1 Tax=Pelagibacterium flavum TaxID=2984530 RepID=A0ABY6IKQ4_9HYPH|nr:SCP2 sterol-binding domain-containing protein [Pelagibacterium sp. YIM 151497]UYQ71177.1 SCP2 sterol-binding domain-containing protein [Pelagibacterium sp. YIM 151497]